MELCILIFCMLLFVMLLLLFLRSFRKDGTATEKELEQLRQQLALSQQAQSNSHKLLMDQMARQNETMVRGISVLGDSLRNAQEQQQSRVGETLMQMEGELHHLRLENQDALDKIRTELMQTLERFRRDNQESLDKINGTVNEKLQKTLDDKISQSFAAVNQRLAEVYAGLGEMKAVASGVSDLKQVLSNVKTRGILGEIQLSAILGEILAPEQYGEQMQVRSGSAERVDFAVKLPGKTAEEAVLLPIDSKFPGDTYAKLVEACDSGDSALWKARRAALETEIKRCAKSIRDKYIQPPYTTDFAILFLPFEGLYAEVVNMGLVEVLQREYKVNIAGPSTMAAMLNSLQMGFRTLAIQQKSGEVWKVLEEAKKEFANFETVLVSTRNRLRQADEELEKLIGTRTRAINRKLQQIEMQE